MMHRTNFFALFGAVAPKKANVDLILLATDELFVCDAIIFQGRPGKSKWEKIIKRHQIAKVKPGRHVAERVQCTCGQIFSDLPGSVAMHLYKYHGVQLRHGVDGKNLYANKFETTMELVNYKDEIVGTITRFQNRGDEIIARHRKLVGIDQ